MLADTSQKVFRFVAEQVGAFLIKHENKTLKSSKPASKEEEHCLKTYRLGLTFSFAVDQRAIDSGYLIRWTKGFNIPDALGKDVCIMLEEQLDALHLPVSVVALTNDTVAALVARAYVLSQSREGATILGCIFGTGTNGAYVEKIHNITKLDARIWEKGPLADMIINTEWGSFDNELTVLPNTIFDVVVDKQSVNPGIQMFEKRVSGMYLGELLRLAILDLYEVISTDGHPHVKLDISSQSPLFQKWGVDTSLLSRIASDISPGLEIVRRELSVTLQIKDAGFEDCIAAKLITHAIGTRAGRLAGVAIAAVLVKTRGVLHTRPEEQIDVGVDGSLIEFYPGFEDDIRSTLRDIEEIGPVGERQISIGMIKDGSAVGAALIAQSVDRQET